MSRRSYSPFTPLQTIRNSTSVSGPGTCFGLWVRSTGKYHSFYFPRIGCSSRRFLSSPSALTLWKHDNSLTIALDVCKVFLELIEYLITFYPGPGTCHISPPPYIPGQPSLSIPFSPAKATRWTPRAHSLRGGFRRRVCPDSHR